MHGKIRISRFRHIRSSILKNNETPVYTLIISTGVSSVVTQLAVIREFLARFSGNEYVISIVFFNWLILGGLGALLCKQVKKFSQKPSGHLLGMMSYLLCGIPVLQVFGIRCLEDPFFIYGSSVGFYQICLFSFFILAPYAVLLGFVLPYSLFVMRKTNDRLSATHVYIADNIGDIAGGALFSFLLIFIFTPLKSLCIAGIILFIATSYYFRVNKRGRFQTAIISLIVLSIILFGAFFEHISLKPKEGDIVFYEESRFGRVTVHHNQGQYTLITDGVPRYSNHNVKLAEEIVHYPLSQQKCVDAVLVISGQGGIMGEIEKYGPSHIWYLEIDKAISEAIFDFGIMNRTDGLEVIHEDAGRWLLKTNLKFDAIIMNISEPDTFQTNRFFTQEFFHTVKAHLLEDGVFSFYIQGFDNYLTEPGRQKISSIYNTLSLSFKDILILPGDPLFFIAKDKGIKKDIPGALEKKGIETDYLASCFYGNVTDLRMDYIKDLLDTQIPLNRAASPHLMKIMFDEWFRKFQISPYGFYGVLLIFVSVYLARLKVGEYILFTSGVVSMGSEIIIIFTFQMLYGYIYFQIGIIVTTFLAGLLPGAWVGEKYLSKGKRTNLFRSEFWIIFLLVAFVLMLKISGQNLPVGFFLVSGFLVSFLCGFQFPLASVLDSKDSASLAGAFSADIVGASFGILITSLLLIPFVGIYGAVIGLIVIKLSSLIILSFKNNRDI